MGFVGFRIGRTRHAGKLVVHAEIVLEGDGCQRLVFVLDLDAFFGLDRLVQAIGPAPTHHQSSCELVDNDDFVVLDHILLIAEEQVVSPQGERSEERRVGKECVSTCRTRWSTYHSKKQREKQKKLSA